MNDSMITNQRIRLDRSRPRVKGTETPVLIYDDSKDCYYETSIDVICSAVLRRLKAMFEEESAKIEAMSEDHERRMAAMEKSQAEFIADTAKVNAALIDMVKSHD